MYNAEKYIKRCLNSVFNQGLEPEKFEVIIINDGSTDYSLSLVKEMKHSFSNLIIIDKENGGQGAARNLGLEIASGDYIMFLDSDDYLVDYQIKGCLKKTIENNLDVCCMRMQRLLPSGVPAELAEPLFSDNKVYAGSWLLLHNYFPASVCAHFFKREFLLRSGIRFLTDIMHEDVDFQLKLFAHIDRFMFCHIVVYVYYYNPESTDRMMDIKKQKRSIRSVMRTCADLNEYSTSNNLSYNLKSYYKRVSNSQMLSLCLKLIQDNALGKDFKKEFIKEAFKAKLLPIKGSCFSWKSNVLKPVINIWSFYKYISIHG